MHLECYIMQTYTVICISVYIKSHTGNTMKLKENWKKTWKQMSINFRYKRKQKYLPQTRFFWACCIKIWWMLSTLFRSTRHSAVSLRPDSTQSLPHRPSTANEALYGLLRDGCFCQAALCKATFSKRTRYIYRIISAYTYNVHVWYAIIFYWTTFSHNMILV